MSIVETADMRSRRRVRRWLTYILVGSVVIGGPALIGAALYSDAVAARVAQVWPMFMAYLALAGGVVWTYLKTGSDENIATIRAQGGQP